ncbi:hypothetical protein HDA30_001136 [Micrococcus cohnii]|mgnify:CR=1 FL=1|uniref:ApeA N-terminal domain-containing protein n=1 Tax=Micrococcus cohnii TaxID=993416 RepID=A0A7W7GNY6_9MICC|nr:hypothetical protein [Micrococcus cohnii]MBB4735628.1 hypothetical protein [Micrococcus cohnii]
MFEAGASLGDALGSYGFVQEFAPVLKPHVMSSPIVVEALVGASVQDNAKRGFHAPKNISEEEWASLIMEYLNGDEANLNYVRLLKTARSRDILGLNDDVRIRAIQRCEELETSLLENPSSGLRVRYEVGIGEEELEKVSENEDGVLEVSQIFSRTWLEETLDFPSILNNLQILLGFADDNVILTLPSYGSERRGLERLFTFEVRSNYPRGTVFSSKENISLLQLYAYSSFLADNDIELEDVFAWFCAEYLSEWMQGERITFTRSTPGSSNIERIRHLLIEMESVMRQYNLFVKYKKIDASRLIYGSDSLVIEELPSQASDKYALPQKGGEIESILYALFSDQSSLNYIDENRRGDSFAELILSHSLSIADFHDYQTPAIQNLRKLDVLDRLSSRVRFRSGSQVRLLGQLYRVGAINTRWLDTGGRSELLRMDKRGWLNWSGRLFTREEASFLNFMLNDREFSDGPKLRNSYIHARVPLTEAQEGHRLAYLQVLLLMSQVVIKINDDFRVAQLGAVKELSAR